MISIERMRCSQLRLVVAIAALVIPALAHADAGDPPVRHRHRSGSSRVHRDAGVTRITNIPARVDDAPAVPIPTAGSGTTVHREGRRGVPVARSVGAAVPAPVDGVPEAGTTVVRRRGWRHR